MWILTENNEEKEIDVKDLIKSKDRIAIHCNTEDRAKEYLDILKENNVKWCSKDTIDSTRESCYGVHQQETCYEIDIKDKTLSYSDIGYFKDRGHLIYKYIQKPTHKKGLKVWELEKGKRYKETTTISQINSDTIFELDSDGELVRVTGTGLIEYETECSYLRDILQYEFEEIEDVFPREDEYYYVVQLDSSGTGVGCYSWQNDTCDKEMLKCNNVFKTREEAEAKLEEIKKVMGIK